MAALLVGLSKAGFGAGAGLLAVPLMASVLDPSQMLSVMLLVLIAGDVFSVVHYPTTHDRRNLAMLIPGLVAGIAVGYLVLGWFLGLSDAELWLRRMVGAFAVTFVMVQFVRAVPERGSDAPDRVYTPRAWHGIALGAGAGITSTLAHAGGPMIAIFLLPQRLEKRVFVGTVIKFFFIGNVVKLVPYFIRGLMTWDNALLSLMLVPFVVLGTIVGVRLNRRVDDRVFRLVIYVLAFCFGVYLLSGWRPGA